MARRRRMRLVGLFALVCLLVVAGVAGWSVNKSTAQVENAELLVADGPGTASPVSAAGGEHPAFARLGERNLLLPVAAQDTTIIAYQPVEDERAIALEPIGAQMNRNVIIRALLRVFSGEPEIRYYILGSGEVAGSPTASVDVGALAGTPITSPVSGVVVGVKPYKLYGRYDDVQVDIRPEGAGSTILSLIFIDQPAVTIGEVVAAGKTQIGKVRAPEGDLGNRLATYTHDAGARVHIQVSEEPID